MPDRSSWRGLVRCERCGQKQAHKVEHHRNMAVVRDAPIGCIRCGHEYGTYVHA